MINKEGSVVRFARSYFVACLIVAVTLPSGAALALATFNHTTGTNYHGHSDIGGGETHNWTDHETAYMHASGDKLGTNNATCSSTATATHVHCTTTWELSDLWSHHYGPDILNHHM